MHSKSNYPKISAFLPVYNNEPFIIETIESILIQDYPNLEIVIGDDGSTDNTVGIITEYKKKYPDIIKLILSEKNTGITANSNRVLSGCTGEFISFTAGDDIWLPGKLHRQIEWFKRNPDAVLCYTKTETFDSETGNEISIMPNIRFEELLKLDELSIIKHLGASLSSVMVRSCSVPEGGYNCLIPMVSDWLFFSEIIYKKKIGHIDEVLARYRRHNNNSSNNSLLIVQEHYLTLQIAKLKFPDLIEHINKYEIKNLAEIVELSLGIIDYINSSESKYNLWYKLSNQTKVSTLSKWYFFHIFKRFFKRFKNIFDF